MILLLHNDFSNWLCNAKTSCNSPGANTHLMMQQRIAFVKKLFKNIQNDQFIKKNAEKKYVKMRVMNVCDVSRSSLTNIDSGNIFHFNKILTNQKNNVKLILQWYKTNKVMEESCNTFINSSLRRQYLDHCLQVTNF